MNLSKLYYFAFVILIQSCSEYRKETINIPISGIFKTYEVKRVIDTETLIIDQYKSGDTFLKVIKIGNEPNRIEEAYFYYENGNIMEYKYYVNDSLYFYTRYDMNGKIYNHDGYPFLHIEDPTTLKYADINVPWVYKAVAIAPPRTILNSWHGGNEVDDPFEQIISKTQTLKKDPVEGDTLGFIFTLPDTTERRLVTLWSLEDSLSGDIIRCGRIISRFKGK